MLEPFLYFYMQNMQGMQGFLREHTSRANWYAHTNGLALFLANPVATK